MLKLRIYLTRITIIEPRMMSDLALHPWNMFRGTVTNSKIKRSLSSFILLESASVSSRFIVSRS
jgi:hypothetical protein